MSLESEDLREKVLGCCSKFFSIIIATILAIITLIYMIGAGRLIDVTDSFFSLGFAHFLAILSAVAATIGYCILHVVPRKAYRLLYLITSLLALAIFLVSHSLGLTAPTVDDCDELGFFNATQLINATAHSLGDVGYVILNGGNGTQAIGQLGQAVDHCVDYGLTFASAFILIFFYVIALFDTQRLLLTRVRSKTYGERFVEMGIK